MSNLSVGYRVSCRKQVDAGDVRAGKAIRSRRGFAVADLLPPSPMNSGSFRNVLA